MVSDAAFSPDSRRVVTASYDGTARVWDAATGEPITPPLKHKAAVLCAVFSPDGHRVATGSADETARIWNLAPDDRSVDDLILIADLLSNHRIDPVGASVSLELTALREMWETLRSRHSK